MSIGCERTNLRASYFYLFIFDVFAIHVVPHERNFHNAHAHNMRVKWKVGQVALCFSVSFFTLLVYWVFVFFFFLLGGDPTHWVWIFAPSTTRNLFSAVLLGVLFPLNFISIPWCHFSSHLSVTSPHLARCFVILLMGNIILHQFTRPGTESWHQSSNKFSSLRCSVSVVLTLLWWQRKNSLDLLLLRVCLFSAFSFDAFSASRCRMHFISLSNTICLAFFRFFASCRCFPDNLSMIFVRTIQLNDYKFSASVSSQLREENIFFFYKNAYHHHRPTLTNE